MDRERVNLDVVREWLEAADALQFHRLGKCPGNPKGPFRNPEIQGVTQWPGANDAFRGQFGNGTYLFSFKMEPVGLNLAQVNFHDFNLRARASATRGGTKPVTSPPSRAISLTMRELR